VWVVIANPVAGGFTIPSRWKKHYEQLLAAEEKAHANPVNKDVSPCAIIDREGGKNGLIATTGPGHAFALTQKLIDAAPSMKDNAFYVIITAGGDGTSREVLSALVGAPLDFRANCVIVRLPMGTGNDGADAWEVDKALDALIFPSQIVLARSLRLMTATPGKGPFRAFNVLSVGLDAFVTHYTNKMKGSMPGDSYKLWVDIASLFYDKVYHVGPMLLDAFDESGKRVYLGQHDVLLMAVGISGRRTYGSHKWILPDERNVCILKQMSLLRKIALKEQFNTGSHVKEKEAIVFSAHKVCFSGLQPILAQMDGETVLLKEEDFPASIELTEPLVPQFVRAAEGDYGRK
jgi:diacylglycerol kinase family enzyme